MAHDNFSYAKRENIFGNEYKRTKIFGMLLFLVMSVFLLTVNINAAPIANYSFPTTPGQSKLIIRNITINVSASDAGLMNVSIKVYSPANTALAAA